MNIQQLKYVIAVANNGSFREAARKLYVTQPSLSNGIKELEEEIGLELFVRTNKGAYLTDDGRDFLIRAERIVQQMGMLENRYQQAVKQERFSIASQHYDFIGGIIAEIMPRFPEYKDYRIYETTTANVIEEVAEYHSEIGLIYMNNHNRTGILRNLEQNGLIYQRMGDFQTHIFLGKHHPLANQSSIKPEELLDFPQVRFTQDGQNFAYFSEDLLETSSQETVIYTTDRGTLMNILCTTDAYASGSGLLTGPLQDTIRLIPLVTEEENQFCVLYPKNRKLSPPAKAVVQSLKKNFWQR